MSGFSDGYTTKERFGKGGLAESQNSDQKNPYSDLMSPSPRARKLEREIFAKAHEYEHAHEQYLLPSSTPARPKTNLINNSISEINQVSDNKKIITTDDVSFNEYKNFLEQDFQKRIKKMQAPKIGSQNWSNPKQKKQSKDVPSKSQYSTDENPHQKVSKKLRQSKVEAGKQNTETAIAYEIWSSVIAENTRNSGGFNKSTVFVPDPKPNRENTPGLDDGKSTTSRFLNNISSKHQMLYEKGQEMLLKKTQMIVTQKLKKEMSIEREANFQPKINKWRSRKNTQDPESIDHNDYLPVEDRLLAWADRKT